MHSFTWANVLGQGVVSPVGVAGTLALLLGYAWVWRGCRRAGGEAPLWRAGLFLLFGVVPLAVATCSGLAALRGQSLQAAAWQAGLLMAVVPAGLALGEPMSLLHRALPVGARQRFEAVLGSRAMRALAYPAVATTLAVVLLLVYLFTPWFGLTLTSAPLREATYLVLVGAGCLFTLPLMGQLDDALPAWCTPGVRVLLAFADGLADAVPGIVVMTTGVLLWQPSTMGPAEAMADEHLAGGVLLGLAEVVGIPVLIATFVAWVRADAATTRESDRRLDEAAENADGSTTPWWLTAPAAAPGASAEARATAGDPAASSSDATPPAARAPERDDRHHQNHSAALRGIDRSRR